MDLTTSSGTRDIELIGLDPRIFDFPKPVDLIQMLCLAASDEEDLVVDFFAGSGTTGHSVMAANVIDGGKRRFLLVQLPEPTGVDSAPTIAALTRQRVRAASAAMRAADALGLSGGDLGFRAFRLEPSQFKIWDSGVHSAEQLDAQLQMAIDHVVDGATEASMLSELLLKAGYQLTAPVAQANFAGTPGYSVADGALLVCLSRQLSIETFEAMVELGPLMIVVLDAGFGGSDELKVNALQTVRARNQQAGSDIALRVV